MKHSSARSSSFRFRGEGFKERGLCPVVPLSKASGSAVDKEQGGFGDQLKEQGGFGDQLKEQGGFWGSVVDEEQGGFGISSG